MELEKIVHLEYVGEVKIQRRKGLKGMNIRINSKGEVKMSIPYRVPLQLAVAFLHKKRRWIIKTIHKMKEEFPEEVPYEIDDIPLTRLYQIHFKLGTNNTYSKQFLDRSCTIFIPHEVGIAADTSQDYIKKTITDITRMEAKEILLPRLRELSGQYGFHYQNVRFKKMRSRWGSCSVKNNINLNIHLVNLPDHLSDYVLLHELVHTRIKHHGPEFWQSLESICPGSRKLSKELKNHGIKLD